MTRGWTQFTGDEANFASQVLSAKRRILTVNLAGELDALVRLAHEIALENIATRDFGRDALRLAIVELAAAMPVYRTYIDDDGPSEDDRAVIAKAVGRVERGQGRHPVGLADLPRRHVEVGNVEDSDRFGIRRQDRDREVAERVLDSLVEGGVREGQRTGADPDPGCCGKATAHLHTPTVDCRDMSELKTQLETDMRAALKARDKVTLGTLRMVLTAIKNEEVAGKSAHELSDDEVVKVLTKQAKQRREAAEAFREGDRPEQAEAELAEEAVIKRYLPEQLGVEQITQIVRTTIAEGGFSGPRDMGKVMKAVQPKVAGRAEGKLVADVVKREIALLLEEGDLLSRKFPCRLPHAVSPKDRPPECPCLCILRDALCAGGNAAAGLTYGAHGADADSEAVHPGCAHSVVDGAVIPEPEPESPRGGLSARINLASR
jgi:uncharacterized protein YqeY